MKFTTTTLTIFTLLSLSVASPISNSSYAVGGNNTFMNAGAAPVNSSAQGLAKRTYDNSTQANGFEKRQYNNATQVNGLAKRASNDTQVGSSE